MEEKRELEVVLAKSTVGNPFRDFLIDSFEDMSHESVQINCEFLNKILDVLTEESREL